MIIKFGASWCDKCQILNKMLHSNGLKVDASYDLEQDPDKAVEFNIKGLPTMIRYNPILQKEVDRYVGLPSLERLKSIMEYTKDD